MTCEKSLLFGLLIIYYATFFRDSVKGTPSGLRHFWAIESPLKIMKNAFYFSTKALYVLKIIKFLSSLFGHVALRHD